MITSGKFNSTHRVLGLKQLVLNGEPQVGFYEPNYDELETVDWIMRTFVKYGSYSRTLEECDKLRIKNLNGEPFKTHALVNLLTNRRYIGRWELNVENKDKDEQLLMPYDRYVDVELSYGSLIDDALWNQVQCTVKKIRGSKDKNTKINRVYPLSGILKSKNGSNFSGGSAWKGAYRHTYYHDRKSNMRIQAELIENATANEVAEILRGSSKMQKAIADYGSEIQTASDFLMKQFETVSRHFDDLEDQKKQLNKRADWILDNEPDEVKTEFRAEYKSELAKLNAEIALCEHSKVELLKRAETLKDEEFNWSDVGGRCETILRLIQEKDPVALKNAYRMLFSAIIVGDLGSDGATELQFILKDENDEDLSAPVNGRKDFRIGTKLARDTAFAATVSSRVLFHDFPRVSNSPILLRRVFPPPKIRRGRADSGADCRRNFFLQKDGRWVASPSKDSPEARRRSA
jgi:hypothetical protein